MGVGRPRAVHTVRSRCRQQVGAPVPMHVPKVGLCRQQAGARNKADTGAHAGREHVCPCMEEGRCFVQIEHDCCVHNMKSCELLPDPHLPPASRYLCVINPHPLLFESHMF